jgi:hypothetical protein
VTSIREQFHLSTQRFKIKLNFHSRKKSAKTLLCVSPSFLVKIGKLVMAILPLLLPILSLYNGIFRGER